MVEVRKKGDDFELFEKIEETVEVDGKDVLGFVSKVERIVSEDYVDAKILKVQAKLDYWKEIKAEILKQNK